MSHWFRMEIAISTGWLGSMPPWAAGAAAIPLPVGIALFRRQWVFAAAVAAVGFAAGSFGGWIGTAVAIPALLLLAILSPASGVGSLALAVCVSLALSMLYAVEFRFPDVYAKSGLPSLVGSFGNPPAKKAPAWVDEVWHRNTAPGYRTFTSVDGRTITAKIEVVSNQQVTLVREDGQRFTVPIERFSPADQEAIRRHDGNRR